MKVSDLITLLQKMPADAVVVLAADGEGNSFDTVHQITKGVYEPEEREFTEEEPAGADPGAVCIWP